MDISGFVHARMFWGEPEQAPHFVRSGLGFMIVYMHVLSIAVNIFMPILEYFHLASQVNAVEMDSL